MLRLAQPADLESVFDIYMQPGVIPYLGYDPMSLDDFQPIFQELVDSKSFYVLERAGAVAGFCRAQRQPGRASHVAYLGTFAVSPACWGTGVASELIEAVIAKLRSQGVLRVELMLEVDNARALAFYRKLGFIEEGLMRAAYKRGSDAHYTDEIFMAKLLEPLSSQHRSSR